MSVSISSLPSPKIRFKELDVEFLQKQARIWLEAVIGERFDQSVSLSSLLADGEILRKVSSKIWEYIKKHGDKDLPSLGSVFPAEASSNGKHSGRYLPYSNIDTFLKVCQKFGLTGVDLFSPPDVVEEKDIRRVCLCIRALSQKARARNVKVPNFDYVTHSEIQPTEIVGGVKSLTNHLNAAISENKETIEKLSWNTPLPKQSTDYKSTNGQPHFSSVEIPKEKDIVSSSLVTDAGPKVSGKSYKRTVYTKGLPSSSPEEISKSTNDAKVISARDETTVYYDGFRKKTNRALFEDDKHIKQSSSLNQEIPYKSEACCNSTSPIASTNDNNLEEILCTMDSIVNVSECPSESVDDKNINQISSLNQEIPYISEALCNSTSTVPSTYDNNSEEILCTMDSIENVSECPSDSVDEQQPYEQTVDTNPNADRVKKHKLRKTWPVITIAMAVLGAAFILRREPRVYGQIGKDSALLQIPKDTTTNSKTDNIHLNEP